MSAQLVRRNRLVKTVTVGAAGTATASFDPVPPGYEWHVERITVYCSGAAASVASVYHDGIDPLNLLDYTLAGNADVAVENPPVVIFGGEQLAVQWTGATVGASCSAVVQYVIRGGADFGEFAGSPEGR